jgi:hypothetical protein
MIGHCDKIYCVPSDLFTIEFWQYNGFPLLLIGFIVFMCWRIATGRTKTSWQEKEDEEKRNLSQV